MEIREATLEDIPALMPLFRGYADFYESDPDDADVEALLREVIAAPENEAYLLVATDDEGKVVGFANNDWKWSSLRGKKIVLMDDLFVHPDARGRRVRGRADQGGRRRRAQGTARPTSSGTRRTTTTAPRPSTTGSAAAPATTRNTSSSSSRLSGTTSNWLMRPWSSWSSMWQCMTYLPV